MPSELITAVGDVERIDMKNHQAHKPSSAMRLIGLGAGIAVQLRCLLLLIMSKGTSSHTRTLEPELCETSLPRSRSISALAFVLRSMSPTIPVITSTGVSGANLSRSVSVSVFVAIAWRPTLVVTEAITHLFRPA